MLWMRADRFFFCVAGIGVLQTSMPQTNAAILNWNNGGGGAAGNAVNWNPQQSPGSADDLIFNVPGSYVVTYNPTSAASASHTYRTGTVNATISALHTVAGEIRVGAAFGDNATLAVNDGTLASNGAVTISSATGASGNLNIAGRNSQLRVVGINGDLRVGNTAQGTLTLSTGGRAIIDDDVVIGSGLNSNGILNVQGVSFLPLPSVASQLDVGSSLILGTNGTAALNISSGARVLAADTIVMAPNSTSHATITVGGSSLLGSSQLFGDADLEIGSNGSGAIAGEATCTIETFGVVDIEGTTFVGDPDGSTSTLHLNGGAFTTTSLEILANGELELESGTLDVDGGTFEYANPARHFSIGDEGHPVMTLRNGCVAQLLTVTASRGLTVAGGSILVGEAADFDVRSGSSLQIPAGDVVFGASTNDQGSMIIHGSNSLLQTSAAARIAVGQSGSGRLEAELGGQILGGRLDIASNVGSNGFVLIENPTTAASFETANVGGTNVAGGGEGTLFVNADATCTLSSATTVSNVWGDGELLIENGGEVRVVGQLDIQPGGLLFIHQGRLEADLLRVIAPGSVSANGAIDAHISLASTGAILDLTGDLDIANPTIPDGLSNTGGIVNIGDHRLRLLNSLQSRINTVNLGAQGEIVAPISLVQVSVGRTLTGDGVIDAEILNLGTISSVGTGLTFKRLLRGAGESISGATLSFIDGGGFEGGGVLDAPIAGDSAAVMRATSNLTMGKLDANGVNFAGKLDVGPHQMFLIDSNQAIANAVDLRGGILHAENGLRCPAADIRGHGEIATSQLILESGFISPEGVDSNDPIGQLLLSTAGTFAGLAGGSAGVLMDLGASDATNASDRITFSGPADLTHVTAVINVEEGAIFTPGTTRLIFVHGGPRIGNFKAIQPGPNNPQGLRFEAIYGSNTTSIRVLGIVGDLNCDGTVSVSDIGPFVLALTDPASYDAQFPACGINVGDINGDGFVSVSDIGPFVALLTGA